MENKNKTVWVGIGGIILGFIIAWFCFGNFGMGGRNMMGYNTNTPTPMHSAMSGIMGGLEGKTGDALDIAFLDGMIIHHEGAVEMATLLLQNTKRPELIKLSNEIITAQTQEIGIMKQWRRDWFYK